MKTLLFIFGTRPEVIKLAPVIIELKKYPKDYKIIISNTEQQKELSNQTLSFFSLKADYSLDVMRKDQKLAEVQSRILSCLEPIFSNNKIDITIVQGDTMSVFCGALCSFYHKVPVFHIEAGLRSYNKFEPFPEESIRQMVSRVTDINFAPTQKAYNCLVSEGIDKNNIYVTGNTVIDAFNCISPQILSEAKRSLEDKGINLTNNIVLVTAHRRENHGSRVFDIIEAIKTISNKYQDHSFIIPVHPNPNVKEVFYSSLSGIQNIVLTEPLDYPELVLIMKKAKLIMTDSGGIQEEAPSFGTPILVLRYETERQEGVDAGFAKLVGADSQRIIQEADSILSNTFESTRILNVVNPYGDGKASQRIEQIIRGYQ